jgi:antitoxin FitA
MPTTITIRDVPDDVKSELAARAARSGRSLQSYLRSHLLDLASLPDPAVIIGRIEQRKRVTRSQVSGDEIIAYRDAERR